MRNSSRKAYPKRNAPFSGAPPKYEGKKLWRNGDTRVKCRDCTHYASHEVTLRKDPSPLDGMIPLADKTQMCPRHSKKAIATGECTRIKPYEEYRTWQRALEKWETGRATDAQTEQQGALI